MSLKNGKLPKTIFVRIDQDSDDADPFLIAHEELDDTVSEELDITKVGTYRLERVESYRRVSELVKEGR